MAAPRWWQQPWKRGSVEDPDAGWDTIDLTRSPGASLWQHHFESDAPLGDDAILAPMEAQFGQVRSRDRVRTLRRSSPTSARSTRCSTWCPTRSLPWT